MQVERNDWVAALADFTRRNASRQTTLSIDADGELVCEERELPLRGVAYDTRDGRIEIMLGELTGVASHLTHSIPHPETLRIVRMPDGRDSALIVGNPDGSAVLSLT